MSTAKIREAIAKAAEVLAEHPEKARVRNAPATAHLEEGLRCRVTGPAGELIHTDMPPGMGGGASAPNPAWFMRAALASCNATGIATRAAKLGINLAKLEVSVSSETDSRGVLGLDESVSAAMRPLQVQVTISAPQASAEDLKRLVEWVCSHSPVGCTDPNTATVDIRIE
jgi:uncharacterized OsmC-like protein